jgi:hypothetical protein
MDIQAIKDAAVTAMLQFGEYPNTVLLHGPRGYMSVQIPLLNPNAKHEIMQMAGKALAKQLGSEVRRLSNIALITEAWMSRRPANSKEPLPIPSQDPNRVEVLVIAAMSLPSRELISNILEIKRHGQFMELVEDPAWNVSKSDMLDAFVNGLFEGMK